MKKFSLEVAFALLFCNFQLSTLIAQNCIPADPLDQLDVRASCTPGQLDCSSSEMTVVGAFLSSPTVCTTCEPGDVVELDLILTLLNGTSSTRPSVAVFADLFVDGVENCVIARCSDEDILPMATKDINFGKIEYICGTSLMLQNILLSWTSAGQNNDCPHACQDISPKCGSPNPIAINPPLFCSIVSSTPPSCHGSSDATIQALAQGGTGPYTYSIQPGAGSNSTGLFTNLSAGINYIISIVDADGCTSTCDPISFSDPDILVCNIDGSTDPLCFDASNGTITASATGGTGAYTFTISPGGTSNATGLFTGLTQGTYSITVKDDNNCESTCQDVTLGAPPALVCSIDASTDPLCFGAADGTITASASGGTGAYTFSINPGGTSNATGLFTGLTQGTYSITVKDANNCESICQDITLEDPPALVCSIDGSTDPLCFGAADGNITASASGGTGAYTFTISPGGTSNATGLFTGLTQGTYSITVKDANNCESTCQDVTLEDPPVLVCSIDESTDPLCFGAADGTITASASGGTGAYTFTISPGGTSNATGLFTGLTQGTYSITVKDANNCESTCQDVTLEDPPALVCSIDGSTDPLCFGAADGTITASASGGTGAYTFTINPGGTSNATGLFTGLTQGTYSITVKDANNCESTCQDVTLEDPPALVCSIDGSTDPLCFGAADGTITASASGGTGVYTFTINPGGTSNASGLFTGLTQGTYSITVKDANNCESTCQDVTLEDPPALVCSIDGSTDPLCFGAADGTITASASGGTGVYTFTINPGGTSNATGLFTGLTQGTYSITVKDANNCESTCQDVTLEDPPALVCSIDGSTDPLCFGAADGTITASASGGTGVYTFTINPGGTSNATGLFTGLTQGTYSITVKDANNCESTCQDVTLEDPPVLVCSIDESTDPLCFGAADGTITASASGGTGVYTFTINPGGTSNATGLFTGLTQGTYSITVKDANNCESTCQDVTLEDPPALVCSIDGSTDPLCFGAADGTITASASGGTGVYTFTINPGGTSNATGLFTGLTQGTYSITVKDANNCESTCQDVTLEDPPALVCSIDGSTDPLCFGAADGTITASASGGTGVYTFTISPGGTSNATGLFTGLTQGTYSITVKDANNCESTCQDVTLEDPPALVCSIDGSTDPLCFGAADGTITASASGGTGAYTFTISPGGTSNATGLFTGLAQGTYSITVKDANNCESTCQDVTLEDPPALVCSIDGSTDPLCQGAGGTISASASGGTGAYTFTINPGGTSNATGLFSGLTQGTYTITVRDANNCESTCQDVTLTDPSGLLCSIDGSTDPLCFGAADGTITASASGGTGAYTFTISPGGTSNATGLFTGLTQGTYSITVKDANNCESICQDITLEDPPALVCSIDGSTDPLCFGAADGNITASASGGTGAYTFTISPGGTSNATGLFTGLTQGTYSITVKDANNCESTCQDVTLEDPPALVCSIDGSTDPLCFGAADGTITASASGGTGAYTFTISPGGTSNATGLFTGLTQGTYTITVKDANNCESICQDVTLEDPPALVCSIDGSTDPLCFGAADGTITASASGGTGAYTFTINPGGTSNATGLFTGLTQGTYSITVKDANNCESTCQDVTLEDPDILTITSIIPTCVDGQRLINIDLEVAGGTPTYSYNWQGPSGSSFTTQDLSAVPEGQYSVTVTDMNGCNTTSSTELSGCCLLEVTCPPINQEIYNCNNPVPTCATTLDELSALGITLGSNPCGEILFTCSDNGAPDYCEDNSVIRTYFIWDDLTPVGGAANGVWDQNEDFEICDIIYQIEALQGPTNNCAAPISFPPCSDPNVMADAYDAWILEFGASGGDCNGGTRVFVDDVEVLDYPLFSSLDLCGDTVEITVVAFNDCNPDGITCSSFFGIEAESPLTATCPGNENGPQDQPQSIVDIDFASWLSGFGHNGGGCDLIVTYRVDGVVTPLADIQAPEACGGQVTVEITVTSPCQEDKCEATFTVPESTQPIVGVLGGIGSCKPGPVPPNQSDVGPAKSDEAILSDITFSACVVPSMITVDNVLNGPVIDGADYTYTRIYTVTAPPFEPVILEEQITISWDPNAPMLIGLPDNLELSCSSTEVPDAPIVTATDIEDGDLGEIGYREDIIESTCGLLIKRTWGVTDACGNGTTAVRTIFYDDKEAPQFTVPEDLIIECGDEVPDAPEIEVTDNCSDFEIEMKEETIFINECEFDIIRTWTVKDACGNSSTKTQTISIRDNTAPTITMVNPAMANLQNGDEMVMFGCNTQPQVAMADIAVNDNCCVVGVDDRITMGDKLLASNVCGLYGYYRKWECWYEVTDLAGNMSRFAFNVLQYDTTAPVIGIDNGGATLDPIPALLEVPCGTQLSPPQDNIISQDDCVLGKDVAFAESLIQHPTNTDQYAMVRTWSALDNCGNLAQADQVVAVCNFDVALISSALGNTVWYDENRNGIQDTTEVGLNDVLVYLYEEDPSNPSKPILVDSTITRTINQKTGQFGFKYLMAKSYRLLFKAPHAMQITNANQGLDDQMDSDADPITGMTDPIDLLQGEKLEHWDAGLVERTTFPVELVSFEVSPEANCVNQITWAAASISERAHFVLQRSGDGLEYTDLGQINSIMSDEGIATYQLGDTDPLSEGYYRLMIVDEDGFVEYSPVVSALQRCASSITEINTWPNPTGGKINLEFGLNGRATGSIDIYDNLGTLVTSYDQDFIRGINRQVIDLSAMPAGVYSLRIQTNHFSAVRKIIKTE